MASQCGDGRHVLDLPEFKSESGESGSGSDKTHVRQTKIQESGSGSAEATDLETRKRESGSRSDETEVTQTKMPEPGSRTDKAELPDTKITLFAVKLALLEKAASGLGTMGFVWATVVLLGGFASSLEMADFWVVTTILSIEGARIFSRSQKVKWHHEMMLKSMSTLIGEAKRLSANFFECWSSNNSNENSGADDDDSQNKALMSKVSRLLLLLQFFSALTYIGLSIYRIVRLHHSGDLDSEIKNLKRALKIFYGLCLAESSLILLEKAYWLWQIVARKLLTKVNQEYGFGDSELETVERFFYAAYSRCVDGSVFDGLKMEFVTHSMELLQSGNVKGQLAGAQVLSALARKENFAEKTLRAIGTRRDVVERLIDMLNFKNVHEQEIRIAAAKIISKLVENNVDENNRDKINRDCIRVTAIDGFMESLASLLYSQDSSTKDFVYLGLKILRKLANERSNHDKIVSSRGLLPRIFALIDMEQLKRQKLALQIVETLASSTGSRGKALRTQIREIVFSISNLRIVLQYKEESKRFSGKKEECNFLQILAIDTLTSLAREQEGRESIGGTGGVLENLFSLFFREIDSTNNEIEKLVKKAGEALGFLSLENTHNCEIMMSIKLDGHRNLISGLISVLNDTVRRIHVARILRNLLPHAKADCIEVREISALATQVLKFVTEAAITRREEHSCESEERLCERLEGAIGLAAELFKFMTKDVEFENSSGVSTTSLISKLVEVLQKHPEPVKIVPNIRRFSLELLIAVMERDKVASEIAEMRSKLVEALEGVLNTTSDWEYYNAFSGSMGLSRHRRSIQSLTVDAKKLLRGIFVPIVESDGQERPSE